MRRDDVMWAANKLAWLNKRRGAVVSVLSESGSRDGEWTGNQTPRPPFTWGCDRNLSHVQLQWAPSTPQLTVTTRRLWLILWTQQIETQRERNTAVADGILKMSGWWMRVLKDYPISWEGGFNHYSVVTLFWGARRRWNTRGTGKKQKINIRVTLQP